VCPYYISSSQILSRSSSIGSTSYPDSNTTQAEVSRIKTEHRESIHSNSSSLLSTKSERKKSQSNLSIHSKTQETVDTAPFTIDSPVHSSMDTDLSNRKKPTKDDYNKRNESVNKLRQSSEESLSTSETNPEEKIMDDE
jgi:hypothetical protein